MWPNQVRKTSLRDFQSVVAGIIASRGGGAKTVKPMSEDRLRDLGVEGF